MVVVEQSVHPLGLSIAQQGKVYTFRQPAPGKKRGLSFEKIALKVKNLKGKKPTWKTCSNVYKKITSKKGYVAYKYKNCGQNNAKLTPDLIKWMITRLLALRKKYVCTSTTLQRELAQKKKVKVEVSTIRKHSSKRDTNGCAVARSQSTPSLSWTRGGHSRRRCSACQKPS